MLVAGVYPPDNGWTTHSSVIPDITTEVNIYVVAVYKLCSFIVRVAKVTQHTAFVATSPTSATTPPVHGSFWRRAQLLQRG